MQNEKTLPKIIKEQNSETAIKKAFGYTKEQIDLVKRTVAKDATNDELAMFMHIAKKTGLNPFLKEIWFYKDNKGNTIMMTGRDGFLTIAQKSGEFEGIQSAAIYEGDEFLVDYSNPSDIKINHKTNPFKKEAGKIVGAWARSKRKGCIDTVEIVSDKDYHKSYAKFESTWDKFPSAMIKKVAESIALRKQYGIAGVVAKEEVGYEDEKTNPDKAVDNNKLFEETKTIIEKLNEEESVKAVNRIINSKQFTEEQNNILMEISMAKMKTNEK